MPNKRRFVEGQVEMWPVRLAYASTVHKSQGLSLDKLQVDVRDHFFSQPAMIYVALSRCRTLEGLRVVGQRERFIKQCTIDERVRPYL
jgi:ATP-dependent exoDNAse (exonuclease V) alpha subunit